MQTRSLRDICDYENFSALEWSCFDSEVSRFCACIDRSPVNDIQIVDYVGHADPCLTAFKINRLRNVKVDVAVFKLYLMCYYVVTTVLLQ